MRGNNYADKLKEVGLTSLEERRSRGDMIQTFRIINEVDNVQAETWFTFASEREREGATSTRHSRDTTKLVQGDSRYELRRNFFSQRIPYQWNSLPQATRQQTTVLGFEAAYDGTTLRHPGLP